jgi:transcriptional regulator with XRE-family HTH domain
VSSGKATTHRRRKVDVAELPTHDEFVAAVGEAIRRERLKKNWTQAELADQVGISSNHVARLERGEAGATFYLMHRIGAALGVDLTKLMPSTRTG